MSKVRFASIITVFLALAILFAAGCGEQKKEEPKMEEQKKSETVEQPKAEEPVVTEQPAVVIPDLKGTWTGRFDSHKSTLKITEQDSTSFKGSITIQYRDVINQQFSGKINLEKKSVSMKDIIKARFSGTYSGNLSDDLKTLSGSYYLTAEKKNLNFNFSRK